MNSCLIIGSGPSKKFIDMDAKYDVDCIICVHQPVHKYTDAVITLDVSGFQNKEKKALDQNIPLIIGLSAAKHHIMHLLPPDKTLIFDNKEIKSNSGAMAIEWAITQGYKHIYTAGIDLMDGYINKRPVDQLNDFILHSGAKTYRPWDQSRIIGTIELPHKL